MADILALYFKERIRSMPLTVFTGAGGSMKSAMVKKLGKLIKGHKFEMTDTPEGGGSIQAIKDLAISEPFIGLDEANRLKEMSNILKVIATGGADRRRILYTTSTMQETPYQARLWLTLNTGNPSEETVGSRMLIFDAGVREEENPYRSEHYLEKEFEKHRNAIWTELVWRLTAAMRVLAEADSKGEGDLGINNRMSSFFVFALAIARQEPCGKEFEKAMNAMSARQRTAASDASEMVDLLAKLPASLNAKEMSAKELGDWLLRVAPLADTELRRKLAKKNYVAWALKADRNMLREQFGLTVRVDAHAHVTYYSLKKLTGNPLELKDLDTGVM